MQRILWLMLALCITGCGKGKPARFWAEQLKDPDVGLRLQAVQALGQVRSEAEVAVPALAGALTDREPFVRRDAARALSKYGVEAQSAAPALLIAMRTDRDPMVRRAAAETIRRIDPHATDSPAIRQSGSYRDQSAPAR
jgi:HEAT repeat protein